MWITLPTYCHNVIYTKHRFSITSIAPDAHPTPKKILKFIIFFFATNSFSGYIFKNGWRISKWSFGTSRMHLSPPPQLPRLLSILRKRFKCCLFVVDWLLLPLCGSMFVLCFVMHCFVSLLVDGGERELFALLWLSSCSLMIVMWLFLTMPYVGLRCVNVVFPDHTHMLFYIHNRTTNEIYTPFITNLLWLFWEPNNMSKILYDELFDKQ